MAKLIAQTGHQFDLPQVALTFGGDASNDVATPADFGLAPCHFAIWEERGRHIIKDTGSGYGVWVNGLPVAEVDLRHGDVISAGRLQLYYWEPESGAAGLLETAGDEERANEQHEAIIPETTDFDDESTPRAETQEIISPAIEPEESPQIFAPMAPPAKEQPSGDGLASAMEIRNAPSLFPVTPAIPDAQAAPAPISLERTVASPFSKIELPPLKLPDLAALGGSLTKLDAPGAELSRRPAIKTPATPEIGGNENSVGGGLVPRSVSPIFSPVQAALSVQPVAPDPAPVAEPEAPTAPKKLVPTAPVFSVAPKAAQSKPSETEPRNPEPVAVVEPPVTAPPAPKPAPARRAPEPPQPALTLADMEDALRLVQDPSPAVAGNFGPNGQPKFRAKDAHQKIRAKRGGTLTWAIIAVLTGLLVAGAIWIKPFSDLLMDVYASIFLEKSRLEDDGSQVKEATLPDSIKSEDKQDVVVSPVPQMSHAELVPKIIWPEARTLVSVGYPEVDVFYAKAARRRGLSIPHSPCPFLERTFGFALYSLERLTSVYANEETPSVVVATTVQPFDLMKVLQKAGLTVSKTTIVGDFSLQFFTAPDGQERVVCGIDQYNAVLGDPAVITRCLQRAAANALRPEVASLWPDHLRKNPGAFLWTMKTSGDAELKQQLKEMGGKANMDCIAWFAIRFSPDDGVRCLVGRDESTPQDAFATSASACLQNMLQAILGPMPETKRLQQAGENIEVEISRNIASAGTMRGEDFVTLFLQEFNTPPGGINTPLEILTQSRTIAHSFNAAKAIGAPEAQGLTTVQEALAALQKGMRGSGNSSELEFQIKPLNPVDAETVASFLVMEKGVLGCRPDLDAIDPRFHEQVREIRDRMNADTVLSLCTLDPKSAKSTALGALIQKQLEQLKSSRGPVALMGLPSLTDDELRGLLRFLAVDSKGVLIVKPGELTFSQWQQIKNPAAIRDAQALASVFNAAKEAGAAEVAAVKNVEAAIAMLARGVKGSGQFSGAMFQCDPLTPEQQAAASAFLIMEGGALKVVAAGK